MPLSGKENSSTLTVNDAKSKVKGILGRQFNTVDPLTQVVVCKRLAKMPMLFLAVRNQNLE